ncbi:cysteine synthase family protein [Streptomyces sp. NBC_00439]|uniref:cysteine synthase family protein n=1 Tax=unclassified Streptomyces TaxID=2593676 RepID=UPI0022541C57|nr:cysteine synthase family protein [Streptomyces sp. NBC_00439]MCX5103585.1 cysteine synthase family protein [Streptomyces sp. NBC_00439]WSX06264.1 cysteine synthase family protein [Streptomyces sp. NBC_00987]
MKHPPYDRLLRSIGNTPLQGIELEIDGRWREVWLKLEGVNPGGSIKDRTGRALMTALERDGRLDPDSIVVESTSGNLGVALAMICQARGTPFVAVVDPTISDEKLDKLLQYGAGVEMVDRPGASGGYLLSRLERVREMCASSARYVWTDQYSSPANPAAHFGTTGPEIHRQLGGRLDALFVSVSTGGTLAGIAGYVRRTVPHVRIVAVDARGSQALGHVPGQRLLTGMGSGRASEFVTRTLYDRTHIASDAKAFALCRELRSELGISVGGSGGAAITACAAYLHAHPQAGPAVCVCPDTGENYHSSIFDDGWLTKHGVWLSKADLAPVTALRAGRTALPAAVDAAWDPTNGGWLYE